MPVEITQEMRVALDFLARTGQEFYVTREVQLDGCQCWVYGGFRTDNYEPGLAAVVCCLEHRQAFERAQARWNDPDVCERFADTEGILAMKELFTEEITNG